MAPRTRAQARQQMEASILQIGREELADKGAAALSLREVARRLGVVSSAVYRYVANRDELLTLLLVDAYDSLADTVEAALAEADSQPAAQLTALAAGMRGWAVAHPEQWGLIYGAPVPGYRAPEAATGGPGTRVMTQLLTILSQGQVPDQRLTEPTSELLEQAAQSLGVTTTAPLTAAAIQAWAGLVGLINLQVFGQLGPDLADLGDELVDRYSARLAEQFSLGH